MFEGFAFGEFGGKFGEFRGEGEGVEEGREGEGGGEGEEEVAYGGEGDGGFGEFVGEFEGAEEGGGGGGWGDGGDEFEVQEGLEDFLGFLGDESVFFVVIPFEPVPVFVLAQPDIVEGPFEVLHHLLYRSDIPQRHLHIHGFL